MNIGSLISGSSAFSKSSLYFWKFLVHILLKPSLKDFQYCLASMLNKCTCTVVDYSLALSLFGVRMKTDIFSYHLGYESIIFFTLSVLNWNWCQCNVGSFKILAVFPSLQFLETFKKSWCYFFKCYLEFALWSCGFCVGKFILIHLLTCHCSVQIFYLFLIWSH